MASIAVSKMGNFWKGAQKTVMFIECPPGQALCVGRAPPLAGGRQPRLLF